jgi:glycosyltransferase involved in cell wall biosynthesis
MLQRIKPNVEFYASGVLPFFRRCWKGRARIVTTCHNLLPFIGVANQCEGPCGEYAGVKRIWKRIAVSAQRSDGIIFLSDHSKSVVLAALGTSCDNVVIAHGTDPHLRRDQPRTYQLGSTVTLLYVSPIYPYKHQLEVAEAIRVLREELNLDLQLRLVGGGEDGIIRKFMNSETGDSGHGFITVKDFLGDAELIAEYGKADIFVFASSCETFGITLVEAMGQRLPVACSKETGLPDLLRDSGVYFDPMDSMSIVCALRRLLEDPYLRSRNGAKAHEYSLGYTWEQCTRRTFCFLSEI